MTEKQIQNKLNKEYAGHFSKKKHKLAISNIFLYEWESDFITINKNNYVTEFEIKCSKWDYLNDFKKENKHESFKLLRNTPNYFYYVCPENMIKLENIPEYSGLIYINDFLRVVKYAPILHKDKFEKWEEIAVKMFYKL